MSNPLTLCHQTFVLAHIIIYHVSHNFASQIYEFCADKQLFSFSNEACPGGVLFKEPLELTEPCFCFNENLIAYSTCHLNWRKSNDSETQLKICKRLGHGKEDSRYFVKLLQPKSSAFQQMTNMMNLNNKYRHRDAKCLRVLNKCEKIPSNSVTSPIVTSVPLPNTIEHESLLLRKANSFKTRSNHHRVKRELSVANIQDEKLRERIEETINLLNELQFGNSNTVRPRSMSLQLLAKTVKIFNYITPSIIAQDDVIDSILTLFLKRYTELELPGYSGRLIIDDHLEHAVFENVMGSLQECASRASDSSQEFEFVTTNDECPPHISHVVHKISSLETGFQRVQYELGGFMPDDRKYVPEREDFILGALWKVFDAVYSYCFSSVFSYRTSQTLNNYFTIISNIFTSPWTAPDFLSENGQGTLIYTSRIEHENLTTLMKNLDYMTEAVHMLSRYKTFFKKPVVDPTAVERIKRQPEPITSQTTTTSESPIFSNSLN